MMLSSLYSSSSSSSFSSARAPSILRAARAPSAPASGRRFTRFFRSSAADASVPSYRATFAHESSASSKWTETRIRHVGDEASSAGGTQPQLGVVIGEFHNDLMDRCLEDARVTAEQMNAKITEVVWVPGSYEAPLAATTLIARNDIDAVIILGYIEKGSTLHGQEMGATVSTLMKQIELQYEKPVGMGIIGPGATAEQAESRVGYAGNAVRAAVRMCSYLDQATAELEKMEQDEQAEMMKMIDEIDDDDDD
ncbi:hypothetical protein PPROV_000378700 [Pycnococcus provasolii]|uniref:6,7-dimethyl-8-ribityllumazine synthase n=1 Tax=Pycnococcus provasolii TaxID=41880 RepID=A0A830HDC0_9CHLO|nr:hypothetical protein PPROV_000378700 [Pycnococcus provasolii]|eukprot:CAMPEP_0206129524 /NCGR_PEP_ID=MMETSP1472-20131121/36661_1 /ASSEMBLY_ACC=CAM_ASM_001108 /TAXON_ID=41880 /ORGANISM="Pycnococcus provasolii, Strain RCC251" /LENGTH=251 /DNA_ID=CAMNT_0053520789 /DNA_START=1 /DNA_END=756 /DNA_ORIENTATION=-